MEFEASLASIPSTRTRFLLSDALSASVWPSRARSRSVVIGQDTRESSAWISPGSGSRLDRLTGSGQRQVYHDAGRRLPDALQRVFCRHRHFGLAQSLARQRHQGFRRRWLQAVRRTRARNRGRHLRSHRAIGRARSAHVVPSLRNASRATPVRASSMRTGSPRLRRPACSAACASSLTELTARRARSHRMVFKDCGITADFLHLDPNGRNINAGCGALHPEHVAAGSCSLARQIRSGHHLRR